MAICIYGTHLYHYFPEPGEKELVVPNGIEAITGLGLSGHTNLERVTLPESLRVIGEYAFAGCSSLETIYIPPQVTHIGKGAFDGCAKLQSVTLPDGLKKAGAGLFKGCVSLKTVTGPLNLLSAEDRTMAVYCWLKAPERLAALPEQEQVKIRRMIRLKRKLLLPLIFSADDIASLTWLAQDGRITRSNVDEEYLQPAQEAKALECIAFLLDWKDKNVPADYEEKKMTRELTRPPKAGPIQAARLKEMWKYDTVSTDPLLLTSYSGEDDIVYVPDHFGRQPVRKLGYRIFSARDATLPPVREVILPDSVIALENEAFCGCASLERVQLPDHPVNIGREAFRGCAGLADENGFVIVRGTLYDYFGQKERLEIPPEVTVISRKAFLDHTALKEITLPEGLEMIDEYAFKGCTGLEQITVPDGLRELGPDVLKGCTGLKAIRGSRNSMANDLAKQLDVEYVELQE